MNVYDFSWSVSVKNFVMEKVLDSKKTCHYTGRQINLYLIKVYFVKKVHVQAHVAELDRPSFFT